MRGLRATAGPSEAGFKNPHARTWRIAACDDPPDPSRSWRRFHSPFRQREDEHTEMRRFEASANRPYAQAARTVGPEAPVMGQGRVCPGLSQTYLLDRELFEREQVPRAWDLRPVAIPYLGTEPGTRHPSAKLGCWMRYCSTSGAVDPAGKRSATSLSSSWTIEIRGWARVDQRSMCASGGTVEAIATTANCKSARRYRLPQSSSVADLHARHDHAGTRHRREARSQHRQARSRNPWQQKRWSATAGIKSARFERTADTGSAASWH